MVLAAMTGGQRAMDGIINKKITMKRNWFNKAIGVAFPAIALKQAEAQRKLSEFDAETYGKRKYDGAAKAKNTEDWRGVSTSANVEVQADIVTLRNRSRELGRNNGYAKNYFRLMPNNIVGMGIIPSFKNIGRSGNEDKIKAVWDLWADDIKCDYDQRVNFYGIQHLVIKTVVKSGECLVIRRRATSKYDIPLRLQVLEGDYIDNGKFAWENEFGGMTWYGVAFNKQGERMGYWLWNRHPGEFASFSQFVDAKDVIHFYDTDRPGQHRGVPELHAGMLRLKDLNDYSYAEMVRAKTAATQVGAIKQDNDLGKDDLASSFSTMEPGTFHRLKPGEEITFNTPPTNNGFGEYVKANSHQIAAAGGVTYEGLTSDLSNVNFSSGRMGWLEFQRNIQYWQWMVLAPHLSEIFKWFLEAAQVSAYLPMGAKIKVNWTMPRREMIDPVKEGKALAELVRGKFKTWREAIREMGDNPDEVLKELIAEYKEMKAAGLMPESFPEFDAERKDLLADKPDPSAEKNN